MFLKKRYLVHFILIVFFSISLWGHLSAHIARAEIVYQGKSDAIFIFESSKIGNQEKLDNIVKKIEATKGALQIFINLTLGVFVQHGHTAPEIAGKRCQVLSDYFKNKLGIITVEYKPKTFSVAVQKEELKRLRKKQRTAADMLIVGVSNTVNVQEVENDKQLEHWQQIILKKYERIVAEMATDCKCWFGSTGCGACAASGESSVSGLQHSLKYLKNSRCVAEKCGEYSVEGIECALKKVVKLQQTSPQLFELAKEITSQRPGAGKAHYDPDMLVEEIGRLKVSLKYSKRAIEVLGLGIGKIKAIEHLPKDKADSKAKDLQAAYGSWADFALTLGGVYRDWYLIDTIDQVRELHNFVRQNIGLPILEFNHLSPICLHTMVKFPDGFCSMENTNPVQTLRELTGLNQAFEANVHRKEGTMAVCVERLAKSMDVFMDNEMGEGSPKLHGLPELPLEDVSAYER